MSRRSGSRPASCAEARRGKFRTPSPACTRPLRTAGGRTATSSSATTSAWVLVDPALQALETGVDVGAQTFSHGLVVDTSVYAPITDLAPAMSGDSGATNMQHMGVVRDFLLSGGGGGPGASVSVTAPNG